MLYPMKKIRLKDGTEATLRSPRAEDAQALLDYVRTTAAETEFVLKYPEECTMTIEQEERFIRGINDAEGGVMILCEVDGRIAGNCSMSMGGRIKVRHRGSVAIALYKEFWGRGIGTALLSELIALAQERGLRQLELEYIEGNERGRVLYEKMGFELVAVKPDAYMLKDGTLRSECIMMKKLTD